MELNRILLVADLVITAKLFVYNRYVLIEQRQSWNLSTEYPQPWPKYAGGRELGLFGKETDN